MHQIATIPYLETDGFLSIFDSSTNSILVDYWTKGIAINPRHDLQADDSLKHFIAETIGTSIKDAMCQLANALREIFVSKDTFHDFTDKYERRLTALEQNRGEVAKLDIPTSAQISVEQAQILRNLVKEKGDSRKGICQIWKKFRQKFQIDNYHRLPNYKFQDALRWLNSL